MYREIKLKNCPLCKCKVKSKMEYCSSLIAILIHPQNGCKFQGYKFVNFKIWNHKYKERNYGVTK